MKSKEQEQEEEHKRSDALCQRTAAGDATILDLSLAAEELTARLVDTPSVSGAERQLATAIEVSLRALPHLTVTRDGDSIVARTNQGRSERVVLAGHIDTVPWTDKHGSRIVGDRLVGRGTTDMKAGVAVQLRLAATLSAPVRDLSFVFFDNEEVAHVPSGLERIAQRRPDWLAGDMAVLLEPTNLVAEAGCQGSIWADVTVTGKAAHSARSWLGENAVHGIAPILARLAKQSDGIVQVDGLEYREGLLAVGVQGGGTNNIVPERCTLRVNYRFAPDKSPEQAFCHVQNFFAGFATTLVRAVPAASPNLDAPAIQNFLRQTGTPVRPKYGWTDVARFAALGIPAINFGPGDPDLAHTRNESVALESISACERRLRSWLSQ